MAETDKGSSIANSPPTSSNLICFLDFGLVSILYNGLCHDLAAEKCLFEVLLILNYAVCEGELSTSILYGSTSCDTETGDLPEITVLALFTSKLNLLFALFADGSVKLSSSNVSAL